MYELNNLTVRSILATFVADDGVAGVCTAIVEIEFDSDVGRSARFCLDSFSYSYALEATSFFFFFFAFPFPRSKE